MLTFIMYNFVIFEYVYTFKNGQIIILFHFHLSFFFIIICHIFLMILNE